MTEAERISFLITHLAEGNASTFAKAIGTTTASATRMRNGKQGIRLRINDILTAYPAINRQWLETGEGHPGDLTVDLVKSRLEEKIKRDEIIIDKLIQRINELEKTLQQEKMQL